MRKALMASVVALSLGLTSPSLRANLLTTDPGTGTTTTFTATGAHSSTSVVLLNGFTVTGTSQFWYGDFATGLGMNGSWGYCCGSRVSFSWVSPESEGAESITIDLGGLFGFVGGFMNYEVSTVFAHSDATITALAADGTTVLDTYDLESEAPISTPNALNDGAFRGISVPTDDIRFFRLSGHYILTHTIEAGSPASTAPEPGSCALLLPVVAGAEFIRQRSRRTRSRPSPRPGPSRSTRFRH
jgi:hypothetical protein